MQNLIFFVAVPLLFFNALVWADATWEARILKLEQEVSQLRMELDVLRQQLQSTPVTVTPPNTNPDIAMQNLVLKGWSLRTTQIKFETYYALDFELQNNYDKAIRDIDGRVDFKNTLGGHLFSVSITPTLEIPSSSYATDQGTQSNGRLLGRGHQMLSVKNQDIRAELVIRKIVFADGSALRF